MVSRPYKSVTLDPHCELRAHMLLLSACVPCTTDRVRSGPELGGSSACRSRERSNGSGGAFSGPLQKCRQTPMNRTSSPPRYFYSPHSALRGPCSPCCLALVVVGDCKVPSVTAFPATVCVCVKHVSGRYPAPCLVLPQRFELCSSACSFF